MSLNKDLPDLFINQSLIISVCINILKLFSSFLLISQESSLSYFFSNYKIRIAIILTLLIFNFSIGLKSKLKSDDKQKYCDFNIHNIKKEANFIEKSFHYQILLRLVQSLRRISKLLQK